MAESDQAVSLFEGGMNCCQAVLCVFGPSLGLDRQTALGLGSAFGGGVGCLGLTCGALTGATLALGLAAQRQGVPGPRLQGLTWELMGRFAARCGSSRCRQLVGPIDTPEGLARVREQGLFRTVCPRLVRVAAELAAELLASLRVEACCRAAVG